MKNMLGKKIKILDAFYDRKVSAPATIIAINDNKFYVAFESDLDVRKFTVDEYINLTTKRLSVVKDLKNYVGKNFEFFFFYEEGRYFSFFNDKGIKCRKN
jgi:hypothetical protein